MSRKITYTTTSTLATDTREDTMPLWLVTTGNIAALDGGVPGKKHYVLAHTAEQAAGLAEDWVRHALDTGEQSNPMNQHKTDTVTVKLIARSVVTPQNLKGESTNE